MKSLFLIGILLSSTTIYAQSLSCQVFDYERKQVQQERNRVFAKYKNRDIEKLPEKEMLEFNQASLLSEKTICTFSGSLKQAFAALRTDKRYGLGEYSPKFPRELPTQKYDKTFKSKEFVENLVIVPEAHQVKMNLNVSDELSGWSYHFILRQEGKKVRIERRQLSS